MTLVDRLSRTEAVVYVLVIVEEAGKVTRTINISFRQRSCRHKMRICSLLPSATEIAFALGLGDQVVAVSHECDYPPEASSRPVLTKSAIHQKLHRSLDVDREVEQRGGDIYEIDEKLLEKLNPQMLQRINRVREKAQTVQARPRVFFMEWLQPPWAGGHWIPQMVDYAGGIEGLGRLGKPSHRIGWEEVVEYQPEIIVLSPCGFNANQVMEEAHVLGSYQGWEKIPAFQSSRIFAVNASAYFSRSGPRVVDGLEILAHIIHPDLFPENPHPEAVKIVPKELVLGTRVIETT